MAPPFQALIRAVEPVFARAEEPPWSALYRIVIGVLLIPLSSRWLGAMSWWAVIPLFLAMLVAVRLVPFIFRRLLPFSREVTSDWARRRRLAKRFDSYQWQKLLWIGLGMSCYIVLSADYQTISVSVTVGCLFAGGWGLAVWSRVSQPRS